jgi:hypothetical protein
MKLSLTCLLLVVLLLAIGSQGFVPRVQVGLMELEQGGKRSRHSMLEDMHLLGEVMDMEGRRGVHAKENRRRRRSLGLFLRCQYRIATSSFERRGSVLGKGTPECRGEAGGGEEYRNGACPTFLPFS